MEQIQQIEPSKPSYNIWKIFLGVLVVCFMIACFSLGIFAMSFAVTFYSSMFSLTDQLSAKAYLREHFTSHMALIYLGIIGMILVSVNTFIYFITFRQKVKLIGLHIIYYLAVFIVGLVSIAGSSDYNNYLKFIVTQQEGTQFEKGLYPHYATYRNDLIAYFASYCIFFFLYMICHFIGSRYEEYLQTSDEFQKLHQNQSQLNLAQNKKKVIFQQQAKMEDIEKVQK